MARSFKVAGQTWSRLIHAYTSMICLALVLFFAVTGLTLNHPDWTFGADDTKTELHGTLPTDFKTPAGVDWLRVAEFLRSKHSLRGEVGEHQVNGNEGTITFRGPGYAADGFFQVDTGAYDVNTTAHGLVAVMNDLHKGRDTRRSWNWLIDLSAIFLTVISLTGLVLQLFLKKRRRSTLIGAGVCLFVMVILYIMAVR
jgi:uncharacterized protein